MFVDQAFTGIQKQKGQEQKSNYFFCFFIADLCRLSFSCKNIFKLDSADLFIPTLTILLSLFFNCLCSGRFTLPLKTLKPFDCEEADELMVRVVHTLAYCWTCEDCFLMMPVCFFLREKPKSHMKLLLYGPWNLSKTTESVLVSRNINNCNFLSTRFAVHKLFMLQIKNQRQK